VAISNFPSVRTRTRVLTVGALASVLLVGTAAVTFAGFSSHIVNPSNSFSTGTVVLRESNGVNTCYSTGATQRITANNRAQCTTIDDLGPVINAAPGQPLSTSTITLTNIGTLPASTSTLTTGACSAAAAAATSPYGGSDTANFCSRVNVSIEDDSVAGSPQCVYPAGAGACPALSATYTLHTLAQAGTFALGSFAPNAVHTFTLRTSLGSAVTNADQGLAAKLRLTWSIAQ
jgi:hypothetical protein